jgi:hypothetical protein
MFGEEEIQSCGGLRGGLKDRMQGYGQQNVRPYVFFRLITIICCLKQKRRKREK